jgi:hypothetical protein
MCQECSASSCRTFRGSGTVIRYDQRYAYVLTNKHVIKKDGGVQWKQNIFIWAYSRYHSGTVIAVASDSDLAIIKVPIRTELNVQVVSQVPPRNGDSVTLSSFKHGSRFHRDNGQIYLTLPVQNGYKHDPHAAYVTISSEPGQSGGGLTDYSGQLIGVNYGTEAEVFNGIRYSLSVRYEHVKNFLLNSGMISRPPPIKPKAPPPPKEKPKSKLSPRDPIVVNPPKEKLSIPVEEPNPTPPRKLVGIAQVVENKSKEAGFPWVELAWAAVGIAIPAAGWARSAYKAAKVVKAVRGAVPQGTDRTFVVDAPPVTSPTRIDTQFVNVESDNYQRAHQQARQEIARRYPGSQEILEAELSLTEQFLSGQPAS